MTVKLDRTAEKAMLAAYSPDAVTHILGEAAKAGATDAARVLRGQAPIGTSRREGQYYRRNSLGHGTFKRSVRAAAIRGRGAVVKGLQGRTIGYVIGPIGRNAFVRRWIEGGTRFARSNPWVERVAPVAFSTATASSEAVLALYGEAH